MMKTATISDVARLAGVSIATVSRVLHNPEKVRQKTLDQVNEAIRESGYAPNFMARNLRTQRSNMILVMVPNIANSFFSEILLGIEDVASRNGYGVLIGNTANDASRERAYLNYLQGNQADGLILLSDHPLLEQDISAFPPFVAISERPPEKKFPFVGIDNRQAAEDIVNHLIEKGHREIGHISGPRENPLTPRRIEGYQRALGNAGIPIAAANIIDGQFTIQSGYEAARKLLQQNPLITAIFCANDESAVGVIQYLNEIGKSVPNDIAVAGFDDIQLATVVSPTLTTIRQPVRQLGEQSMQMMLTLLSKNDDTSHEIILDHKLIVREST